MSLISCKKRMRFFAPPGLLRSYAVGNFDAPYPNTSMMSRHLYIKCTSSVFASRIGRVQAAMEKGGGGGEDPATRAAGGMCDRFLTFLAKNLSMGRVKSIAEGGPKNGAGGGGHPAAEGAEGEDEDEFAIPIERAEFDFEFSGHGDGATVLGENVVTTTRGVHVPEQKVAAAADGPVAAGPAPPAVAAVDDETKVRRTVTIKDDRPAADHLHQEGAAPATVERKKSLFKKRQASSAGAGGGEEPRAPRRSGLRPRMPPMPRVPSNINERFSTFIEERKMGFGGSGKPARDK